MKDVRIYLQEILDRIERIERFTVSGRSSFMESELLQDAVLRNFQIIGEAAKRIPEDLRQQYSDVPWRRVTGLRDVIVHDYADVILDEVWATIERDLPSLKAQIAFVLTDLESKS